MIAIGVLHGKWLFLLVVIVLTAIEDTREARRLRAITKAMKEQR